MSDRFVIIGGDAAGMSAASKLKRTHPEAQVMVLEKGEHISYAACGMPYWLGGIIEDGKKLQVLDVDTAREKRGIDVRTRHEVTSIDRDERMVTVMDLERDTSFQQPYDKLLIATGARATEPPLPGIDLPGVFTLRSLADGRKIHAYLNTESPRHAVIVGAGYIGLEMAENLIRRGLQVSLIELADQIAPTFDAEMLEEITKHVKEQGVELKLATRLHGIQESEGGLALETNHGLVRADMVLVSVGVRPNSELAKDAGLKIGHSGAIRINSEMQTSDPAIFAAGDCAEHEHIITRDPVWIPLATSANKGGRLAGENMGGGSRKFPGVLGTAVVKVFEFDLAQTGLTEKQAIQQHGAEKIRTATIRAGSKAHYYPGATPVHIKLVVLEESGRLLGAQMYGRQDVAKRLDVFATAITAGFTVEQIGMLDLSYAPPFAPVYDPVHVAANVASK